MCMSSSWLIIPGEVCSKSMLNDCGYPPDEAEVFKLSYLLLLFVMPEVALGGVDGICGDLKGPSLPQNPYVSKENEDRVMNNTSEATI